MHELRATIAIVRRHMDRAFGTDFAMQGALAGALGYIFAHLFAAQPIPIVVCGALAAASAAERGHAANLRRVSLFAMPLFGRQLARAHVIAPVLSALAIPLGYSVGTALRGAPLPAETIVLVTLATVVAVLVSLSSVFRDGARAALYVGLAVAAVATIAVGAALVPSRAVPIAIVLAAVVGFFALRAFGETLARYDPLPLG